MQTESKRKFIDGYMWMYGGTKRQALIEWQLSGEGYRTAIIEAWERHCKQAYSLWRLSRCKWQNKGKKGNSMFIVYTGNRFNQILIFDSYDKAADWLRTSTRYSELEIAKAIKTPRDNGCGYLTVSDR